MSYFLTFLAMFLTDLAWALYVSAIKANEPLTASLWAVALFVLGAFAVIGYTRNRWLVLPAAVGAFAGTYAGVLMQLT